MGNQQERPGELERATATRQTRNLRENGNLRVNGKQNSQSRGLAPLLLGVAIAACATPREPAHSAVAQEQTQLGAGATPGDSTSSRDIQASQPGDEQNKRAHELYTYQDVLTILRNNDSVLPDLPPVHPVHTMYNREGIVPPMCYTRTEGQHNPCYVCHQDHLADRPNQMKDGDLQREYSFSPLGSENHWKNLFTDRKERVQAISDEEILAWIAQDNYSDLAHRLKEAQFKGYVPDLGGLENGAAAFDDEGFAKDGSHWVAFNYKPLPSTFWPTNGSTDDVMVRLPEMFRTTADGEYSRDVYKANLALVEANIKDLDEISVSGVDEKVVGSDLNGDGKLTTIALITKTDQYVGAAARHIMLPWAYPQHTEFLHSVRYVGVDEQGRISNATRLKELRYMRKRWAMSKAQLYEAYVNEATEKDQGVLPGYINRGQYGLDNQMGWVLAGFIENKKGDLRFNTYEENFYCMGCHSSIGSTIDSTFSFARKIDGAAGWGYIDLRGMPDVPNVGETQGEIATYLERAGGGGEFRSNPEMAARWFSEGHVDPKKLAKARDVYDLITPSRQRALELNKAYRVIVDDQTFIFGRDATITPPINVYQVVENDKAPTLPPERTFAWDIRLDWKSAR